MRSVRLLDDTEIYLHDEGELVSDHIARESDYFEKDILFYLADKHPYQEVILDVGANIGNHTLYFAQYLEYSQILCFEPVHENFVLLQKNTAQFPNVTLYPWAVGDHEKIVNIQIDTKNMGANEITDKETGVYSKQIPLDLMADIGTVTLIKIDVEWYEPKVLMGAKRMIKKSKPLILIEDATGDGTRGILNHLGYELEAGWPEHKTYLYRSI